MNQHETPAKQQNFTVGICMTPFSHYCDFFQLFASKNLFFLMSLFEIDSQEYTISLNFYSKDLLFYSIIAALFSIIWIKISQLNVCNLFFDFFFFSSVIKLILQFLKEHGLENSFETLQAYICLHLFEFVFSTDNIIFRCHLLTERISSFAQYCWQCWNISLEYQEWQLGLCSCNCFQSQAPSQ
jgi:hypothetical protein